MCHDIHLCVCIMLDKWLNRLCSIHCLIVCPSTYFGVFWIFYDVPANICSGIYVGKCSTRAVIFPNGLIACKLPGWIRIRRLYERQYHEWFVIWKNLKKYGNTHLEIWNKRKWWHTSVFVCSAIYFVPPFFSTVICNERKLQFTAKSFSIKYRAKFIFNISPKSFDEFPWIKFQYFSNYIIVAESPNGTW